MPEFIYEALNTEGPNEGGSVERGQITADSAADAAAQLEAQGRQVTSLEKIVVESTAIELAASAPSLEVPLVNKLSQEQQPLVQRVSQVLEQREQLVPALAAFAEELPPGSSRRKLSRLVARLESGATAEEICDPKDPDTPWLLLLGQGGNAQQSLGSVLDLSAMFGEALRENKNSSQWIRALLYPALVCLGALLVLIFMSVSIVPVFDSMYNDFEIQLPTITRLLVAISRFTLDHPVAFSLTILALSLGIHSVFRAVRKGGPPGRLGNALTMGSSLQVASMGRLSRLVAESLNAGLTLPAALRLASNGVELITTRRTAWKLAEEVEQAQRMRQELNFQESVAARRLPTSLVHALQPSKHSGPSIRLLRQLAKLYSTRVRDRQSWSSGYLAHFAVIAVGLVVGFVVIALFMPLVSLINGLID
ncbi:type II secretion system F family protein [Adhaeretor mobilis]|uniref:General secretion pathway protein F n=1 Tax=Adhaeretor mobilis TaxID=1930276 RepID=A0A517N0Z8_9BACT|nr:type II secretion system F family protein [Adhaeretor mobilis]QDT00794.1 type IV pilin biogenesis protein [Adhaeretor mobilis]